MNILRLHPDGGGPPITIEHAMVRVGRDGSADVHLRDASVSRLHAEIERRGDDWIIVDQNSGNGIRIDGRRTQQAILLPGQQLHIGNLRFRVEVDRGNDGATMMLGRSPLLDDPTDQTLMGGAVPVFPAAEPPPRSKGRIIVPSLIVVILVLAALAWAAYLADQRKKAVVPAPVAVVTPFPTPKPTPTPEPTPVPTPPPPPRPTGSLLIGTDIDTTVSIDGRDVAQLKASGLRRFTVAPGEHIVRFRSAGSVIEKVVRVRVNEQTVIRRVPEAPAQTPTPVPLPVLVPVPVPVPVVVPSPSPSPSIRF